MIDLGADGFAALLEAAPDAILVVEADGRIALANRRAEEMFGYAAGALAGEPVEALVPERVRDLHRRHRHTYSGDPHTRPMGAGLALSGRRRDGTEFPVEISLSALGTDGGLRTITIVRDVTERRDAEARRLRSVQAVSDAALRSGSVGSLLDAVLEPVAAALGAARVEVSLRDGRRAALGPPAPPAVAEPLRYGEEAIGEVAAGWQDPGAASEERRSLLRRLAERIALGLGQARLYEAAQAAEQRLREILGDVVAVIWEAEDPERRRYSFVSEGAERLLGHPVARWTGEDGLWGSMIDPADRDDVLVRAAGAVAEGRDHELEYRLRARDGGTVWVRDRVRVAREPSGRVRQRGIMADVTARRELEASLLQAQKMQAVGQLAGGIAHDFNNVLTAILGYGGLLAARLQDPESLEDLAEIERAARRAKSLTEQLLSFSRRQAHRRELVDLGELVAGLEPMLRRLIDEDLRLELRLGGRSVLVEGDPARLEQVILNLVINARDAMPQGGQLTVTVGTREVDGARWAALDVADTGTGMDEATLARVFEPFFTTKPAGKGTGLGLATVYDVVDQAGGRIAIESVPGCGTEVAVLLPAALAGEEPDPPDERRPTVLIAEDEASLRRLARRVLEADGKRVLEAADGRQALEHLEREGGAIDLLITDVVMPGMGGPELVDQVTERWPDIQVVFASGYADSRLAGRGLDEDGVDLLRKPWTVEELRRRVDEALGR